MNPSDPQWLSKIKAILNEATEVRREVMKKRGVK